MKHEIAQPTAARRLGSIAPFYVMELVKAADALAASGRSIIHLSIGEPDFTAPPEVIAAMTAALGTGDSGYTAALGLPALREAIATRYRCDYGLDVPANRIVITAGASGALLLAMAALIDEGDEVLMPDPCYPCNRHIITALAGHSRLIPCGPKKGFQLSADDVDRHWDARTRGVLLASPANPTGVSVTAETLATVRAAVRRHDGFLVVDEIYNDLRYEDSYPAQRSSALALGDDVIVVNSFSKYFSMTGWRLGWLVLPAHLVPEVEKLAQNLFICASTPAQHAALACFSEGSLAIYEERRLEFKARRDFLVPALQRLGFEIPVSPNGAFYIYANTARFGLPSDILAHRLLHEAGVCCVPGRDFGHFQPEAWMRFSYATSLERLKEAVARMAPILDRLRK